MDNVSAREECVFANLRMGSNILNSSSFAIGPGVRGKAKLRTKVNILSGTPRLRVGCLWCSARSTGRPDWAAAHELSGISPDARCEAAPGICLVAIFWKDEHRVRCVPGGEAEVRAAWSGLIP